MARSKYPRRKARRLRSGALVISGILFGAYILWANAATTSPSEALARARELGASERVEDQRSAESLLSIASRESSIRPWVELTRAQILIKRGEIEAALPFLAKVAQNTPASLDASALLLQISGVLTPEVLTNHARDLTAIKNRDELEQRIRLVGRTDLLPQVLLAKAREFESNKKMAEALGLYLDIRKAYPGSPGAEEARSSYSRVIAASPADAPALSFDLRLREAQGLLAEGDSTASLGALQTLQSTLPKQSPELFQTKLLEEQILRKLQRPTEADHLLLVLSADGPPGVADQALLRIAKNAWNINDHHRALEFLDSLKKRFPASELLSEANYVEARILEETDAFAEAKELYRSIAASSSDILQRLRALRRIAWLHLRTSAFAEAAKEFERERALAEGAATDLRAKMRGPNPVRSQSDRSVTGLPLHSTLVNVLDEKHHATYWLAYSAAKSSDGESAPARSIELWRGLTSDDAFGYYGLLARRALPDAPPLLSRNKTGGTCDSTEMQALSSSQIVALRNNLKHLSLSTLSSLARSEVDWYLLNYHRDLLERLSRGPEHSALKEEQLNQAAIATNLYFDAGDTKRGIVIAKSALRFRNNADGNSPTVEQCLAALWRQSFPQPMSELFTTAATKERAPRALLLAITRSESYFDPLAKSSAGALGLMQLMPETAKMEGMKEGENLLAPSVNVPLGARHLSRLRSMFNNETVYVAAAYNAGVNAVNRWRNRYKDLPPEAWAEMIGYPETATYVRNVVLSEAVYEELSKNDP